MPLHRKFRLMAGGSEGRYLQFAHGWHLQNRQNPNGKYCCGTSGCYRAIQPTRTNAACINLERIAPHGAYKTDKTSQAWFRAKSNTPQTAGLISELHRELGLAVNAGQLNGCTRPYGRGLRSGNGTINGRQASYPRKAKGALQAPSPQGRGEGVHWASATLENLARLAREILG